MQILQTDIHTFPRDKLREFKKRTKHFLFGDHLINSRNHFSSQHMDIVRRKFMLVTIGTKRFKNMLSFRFYDIFIMVFFLLKSSCQSKVANVFFLVVGTY